MNPFRYGQIVSGVEFCPRSDLMKQLINFIKAGQNVLLQGERRIGKTSLIHEALRILDQYKFLYIDILEVKTIEDLCRRMITSLISNERKAGFHRKLLQTLSYLRPSISIDPVTGHPSISIDAGVKLRPDSIEGLLDLIKSIRKRTLLVVVFDEFQDILNINESATALALLRSRIQFHTDITYVFSGSVRNQMNDIFTSPESPFFKSAVFLEVGHLDDGVFSEFLIRKFRSGKRKITETIIRNIFKVAGRIPGDVQELCGCIWDVTSYNKEVTNGHLKPALELIYARERKAYEAMLVQLTGQQLRCLVTLAKGGEKAPLSTQFLKDSGIRAASSVQAALHRLVKLRIIYRHEGVFKFVNPFFGQWLVWKNY